MEILKTDFDYDVYLGKGIFNKENLFIGLEGKKVMIISDEKVWNIYKSAVFKLFKPIASNVCLFITNEGEKIKKMTTVANIYKSLSEHKFSREDYIIGFGGGVILDICGFVASTYMRGLNLINLPTTVIAQVDAAIGGKNGVNLVCGKNLVGTFYNPKAVFCDVDLLLSLEKRHFFAGMAEVIKYYIIYDQTLKSYLENPLDNLLPIVKKSIFAKSFFVFSDPFDYGVRKFLNFGHTIGHALEAFGNFELFLHGEAVALGMLLITEIAIKHGLSSKAVYDEILRLALKFNLPVSCNFNIKKILFYIFLDKKRFSNSINLIIAKDFQDIYIYNLLFEKVNSFLC